MLCLCKVKTYFSKEYAKFIVVIVAENKEKVEK